MPEAKVSLVQKNNFVKFCLPETRLKRSAKLFLPTVKTLPVSYYSECFKPPTKNNIKRVEIDQKIKRVEIDQNKKIKEPKVARKSEAHKKSSSLSSGRAEVPVAYQDDKTCPEQNSKSIIKSTPFAGIMPASVRNRKSEAPPGQSISIYRKLSFIFKVMLKSGLKKCQNGLGKRQNGLEKRPKGLEKCQIKSIQLLLFKIICKMLCPSDPYQCRLWAQQGHLLYFIFKIAPFIIACGIRSCLWPYYYPLDQLPGALESLAFIMATSILSVHFAFDTELIRPLDAHKTNKPNVMGLSRLFYHYNSNRISSPYLARCDKVSCCLWLILWLYNHSMDYIATQTPLFCNFLVILFMTGGSVRLTHECSPILL